MVPEDGLVLQVAGLNRARLRAELARARVLLNPHAETLLSHPVFDEPAPRRVRVVVRSVGELGRPDGGTLSAVLAAGEAAGLSLCPPTSGPYLRLAVQDQVDAPDSVLSQGKSPSGAIHVASAPLGPDDFPRGFYLRVVDGQPWLRGYRCDDEYTFEAGDRFAFVSPGTEWPASAPRAGRSYGPREGPP